MGKILGIVTNQGTFGDTDRPTGLWLGELTHFYDLFEANGHQQDIASSADGRSKQQGAQYEKARLPLMLFTVRDDNLITGQNPGSARAVATDVRDALTGR